ncbi:glycerol kinase GlpK [Sneathiella chungangensis]|uniref:Glycerol kinase n=1 Tax=Sneathiella chungangensis TaxID=1418234 RepID=A0A845MFT8_9PROT|nr:glycerol kinase GlpK [Sneathiella chungangensis]MZR21914.1 glycerol kinase GlpK [Sneathiella chungangensis]
MTRYILAIDQGTTSSRAILFDQNYTPVAVGQQEFRQHFPASGWVEHNPEEIWETTVATAKEALKKAGATINYIAGIGITNQRETTVIWDRETGKPIHNAIVWQDRRTADFCQKLKEDGLESQFAKRTGLLLDPYFSGTKIAWLLKYVEGAREAAEAGKLAFGTIDSFLLWRLTGGKVHATDATNASRTLLYDIHRNEWSDELLDILDIPKSLLPEVKDCAADYGMLDPAILGGSTKIAAIAGDQQAATVGQACFQPGMMKSTYGTGCFALLNTGAVPVTSNNKLLTTIAYQLDGKPTYALEGSIFVAGAAVQWLRDGLGIIEHAAQSGEFAKMADPGQRVIMVPAFVGIGAPYWDANCRGAIYGLTRAAGPKEFARAALDSVCFQTRDLLTAMRGDFTESYETVLRVDGGMSASEWTMQRLADILGAPVDRPVSAETTALGAAYLAGLQTGFYPSVDEFSKSWRRDRRFSPSLSAQDRDAAYAEWQDAVRRTLTNYRSD